MTKLLFLILPVLLIGGDLYYYRDGKKDSLIPDATKELRGNSTTQYFRTSRGHKVGVNNFFLAKLYGNIMIIDVEKYYGVKFISYVTKNVLKFEANSSVEAIEISNKMVEDGFAIYAQPDFIIDKYRR